MARSPIFSTLFGRSPVAPLQAHMQTASDCAAKLYGYFEALTQQDWESVELLYGEISALEEQADNLKREIRLHLPRSLFLPVPRSDVLELVRVQDEIPNRIKDIAGLSFGRQMEIPSSLGPAILEYVSSSVSAVKKTQSMLDAFAELLYSGFSSRGTERIEVMISDLSDLEHTSDLQQIAIRGRLYELEKDMNPVDVMFLYRVIDWIGDLADHAQTVGNRMLYIIAR